MLVCWQCRKKTKLYARQQIQNYELKQRLAALTADLSQSQAASHVQSRSQDASSSMIGPDPSGSVRADTSNSGFVSPDKPSVENLDVKPATKLEATVETPSNTTTEAVLAHNNTPSTSGSPKTYSSVAALNPQVERVSTGTPLPVSVPKATDLVPNATPPASQPTGPSNPSKKKKRNRKGSKNSTPPSVPKVSQGSRPASSPTTPGSNPPQSKSAKTGGTPPSQGTKSAFQSPAAPPSQVAASTLSQAPPSRTETSGKPPHVPRMVTELQTEDKFIPVSSRRNNRPRSAGSGTNPSSPATSNRVGSEDPKAKSDFWVTKRD